MPVSTQSISGQWPFAVLLSGIIFAGLWLSNLAYDHNIPQYVSRKIGHFAGGICFLLAPFLFSSALLPLVLAAAFTLLLLMARWRRPETFRGVGGNSRGDSFAEIAFAAVAIPVYLVGWVWLDEPLLAAVALTFMAWGDGVTGLVRAGVYRRQVKGLWGSFAMLLVCTGLAVALVRPVWAGAVAALAATIAEVSFGDVGIVKPVDDNLAIPVISLAVLLLAVQIG
jgi:phytol kinase